jgi:multisubunit Na+/H+ antiporter MnhB subunit
MTGLLFDLALGVMLLGTAWGALFSSDYLRSVVLFIVCGLLMSLAWARLEAPDVALAEAAIGAGLTGALFLRATKSPWIKPGLRLSAALGVMAVAAVLLAILGLSRDPNGLAAEVGGRLEEAGVAQPVTAVLLNIRAYDTWLELAVLAAALMGALSLSPDPPKGRERNLAVSHLLRMLAPLGVLTAGYFLWAGSYRAGGAFQAGAILGATGAVFLLNGRSLPQSALAFRLVALAGLSAFVAVALASLPSFLRLPLPNITIVFLELAATVSIGLTLLALFALAGGRDAKL